MQALAGQATQALSTQTPKRTLLLPQSAAWNYQGAPVSSDPHAGGPLEQRGSPLASCRAAVIMLHGRNAGPANILELAEPLADPELAFLAPAAAGRTWYPQSFLAEAGRNEPQLSSALRRVAALVGFIEAQGLPRHRIALLGFSQGGCLAAESAVRLAAGGALGGLIALSAGLIGPPGTRWDYPGAFGGMPALFGCSDADAHIPAARVRESAEVFTRMGATVSAILYPGMGHQVNADELARARRILSAARGAPER